MKIINKKTLISYYLTDELDEEQKEYYIKLLVGMDIYDFNRMIYKDFQGFIIPLESKGYFIEV